MTHMFSQNLFSVKKQLQEHVAEGRSLNTQEEYNNAYRYPQYDNNNKYITLLTTIKIFQ